MAEFTATLLRANGSNTATADELQGLLERIKASYRYIEKIKSIAGTTPTLIKLVLAELITRRQQLALQLQETQVISADSAITPAIEQLRQEIASLTQLSDRLVLTADINILPQSATTLLGEDPLSTESAEGIPFKNELDGHNNDTFELPNDADNLNGTRNFEQEKKDGNEQDNDEELNNNLDDEIKFENDNNTNQEVDDLNNNELEEENEEEDEEDLEDELSEEELNDDFNSEIEFENDNSTNQEVEDRDNQLEEENEEEDEEDLEDELDEEDESEDTFADQEENEEETEIEITATTENEAASADSLALTEDASKKEVDANNELNIIKVEEPYDIAADEKLEQIIKYYSSSYRSLFFQPSLQQQLEIDNYNHIASPASAA